MQTVNDPYQDIRPYHDDEVPAAIHRLIQDDEFINAILSYRYPHASGPLGWLLKPALKLYLTQKWRNIKTVQDVQLHVASYMRKMIKTSCDNVTVSGVEHLSPDKAYLFVSNHRDIAMDPALVNWCLHQQGLDTVRIAIGDNLLRKPCATELMKLNKSFIVKRSARAPREMMKSLSQLSAYIRHSLDEGQSIWIAQREGRAKTGLDMTDPAILKMFYMEGRKNKQSFDEYMQALNIVPVAISYQNDPCDLDKATELDAVNRLGAYEKSEFEDIQTIVKGIVGQKRQVHVAFGAPVTVSQSTPETLAADIDRQIHCLYRLYPANYIAAGEAHDSVTAEERELFEQKLAQAPEVARDYIRQMYANPVINAQRAASDQATTSIDQ
ncbi:MULTISPECIES: lysophospholipid acyltransferase family protein [Salinivibrio]|uniref:lysophospholipid acyltransferase family protein n=1 Tax=Salinivibrio TaxID=51366 RepID=UPI000985D653|nr:MULTISPECIES: 1-acyl-sn-glycerol-3-phosphate acyltransferase [Salinivibrio]OOF11154.1 acyltransferase [Salinivibrio sp. PR5]OOF11754.1 acyltransferase [Salinivibrio sp. PR919]OOF17791.1 acyltransferase [Salinivibrio sp. PR932]OOF31189.1 acyltransferase [Salinivibrio proteolyticus]